MSEPMTESTARELIAALQANTEAQRGILGVLIEERNAEVQEAEKEQEAPQTYMDGSPR